MNKEQDLKIRAMTAYLRVEKSEFEFLIDKCGPVTHEGLEYVVLRNTGGVLAVYRLRNQGMLRRLKRWPAALNDL